MNFHATLSVALLFGFASLSVAADNPGCIAEYEAEVARIVSDAGRDAAANPPGPDIKASNS